MRSARADAARRGARGAPRRGAARKIHTAGRPAAPPCAPARTRQSTRRGCRARRSRADYARSTRARCAEASRDGRSRPRPQCGCRAGPPARACADAQRHTRSRGGCRRGSARGWQVAHCRCPARCPPCCPKYSARAAATPLRARAAPHSADWMKCPGALAREERAAPRPAET